MKASPYTLSLTLSKNLLLAAVLTSWNFILHFIPYYCQKQPHSLDRRLLYIPPNKNKIS
jgi:hypothetical protein